MTDGHQDLIGELLKLSFSDGVEQAAERYSETDFHLAVLHRTHDFWDDRGEERYAAADREIEAVRQPLVVALTARWGTPVPVDLTAYLRPEDPTPPEPFERLSQVSGEVLVWRPPGTDRWVGLAVGQADNEFPVELIAVVGVAPLPAASGPDATVSGREKTGRPVVAP
ncbi:hypothetical protein [Plantactinospora sp. B24E8]|uniref:hypothetical protein n=1 Tax=Plantactinospora sp. B24E8 TaxID=3153567 RepID=UPI00325EFC08